MLGHRGCRLAISAQKYVKCNQRQYLKRLLIFKKNKSKLNVEIMIPLVSTSKEIHVCKEIIDKVASTITIKMKKN